MCGMSTQHPDCQMSVRMPAALENRLANLAKRMGLTKADLIRHALEQALPRVEAEGITIRPAQPVREPAAA